MGIGVGYKRTEVGVIPEDWECVELGEYSNITKLAGFEYSKYFNSYNNGGEIIVIRGTNITKNKLDLSDVKNIPKEISNLLKRSQLNKDDLVFAYVGTIGPVYLITESNKYHLGPNTAKITLSGDVLPRYAFMYFTSNLIKKEIEYHTSVGAQPSLSMTKIRKFNIILPPLPEQKAIATALLDIDNLISSLTKLIDKKKNIKQGAMQELLTGKKRLEGFSGDWVENKLGSITKIYTGKKNNEDKVENGMYPFFVRSKQIERINTYSFDGEAIIVPGEGNIGEIFHYINGKFEFHQRVYKISDFSKEFHAKYIYYYMLKNFGEYALRNTVKATVDSLRLPTFQEFIVKTPPTYEEQTAIAQVLSDIDSEIEIFEQKLKKHKEIKQGMMQELLTGRIRLVEGVVQ